MIFYHFCTKMSRLFFKKKKGKRLFFPCFREKKGAHVQSAAFPSSAIYVDFLNLYSYRILFQLHSISEINEIHHVVLNIIIFFVKS